MTDREVVAGFGSKTELRNHYQTQNPKAPYSWAEPMTGTYVRLFFNPDGDILKRID